MSNALQSITTPPIVEAIIDIECAMPPSYNPAEVEDLAKPRLSNFYPVTAKRWVEQHKIEVSENGETLKTVSKSLDAIQFLQTDKKQLVQFRNHGFSFNRLAPYSSLDDYLEEVRRTFLLFVELTVPIEITAIRLRCINEIILPLENGKVELNDYLTYKLQPARGSLELISFAHQYQMVDPVTQNVANIVLVPQRAENKELPLIFDIEISSASVRDPQDWDWVSDKLQSLRLMRNNIFESGVTEKCLNLFQ